MYQVRALQYSVLWVMFVTSVFLAHLAHNVSNLMTNDDVTYEGIIRYNRHKSDGEPTWSYDNCKLTEKLLTHPAVPKEVLSHEVGFWTCLVMHLSGDLVRYFFFTFLNAIECYFLLFSV